MRICKILLTLILSIAVAATTVTAYINNYIKSHSGGYSSISVITETEKDWIMTRFGHKYETVEDYIIDVQNYANKNFKYDDNKGVMFQYYNFNDIENGDIINGICFDFSVLFKHITLVLLENNMLPENEIKVYVTDIRYKNNFMCTHSYNVLTLENGQSYFLDLTNTASLGEKGLKPEHYYKKFNVSIKKFANENGEILYNVH